MTALSGRRAKQLICYAVELLQERLTKTAGWGDWRRERGLGNEDASKTRVLGRCAFKIRLSLDYSGGHIMYFNEELSGPCRLIGLQRAFVIHSAKPQDYVAPRMGLSACMRLVDD